MQKDVALDSVKLATLIRNFHIGSFLNGEAVPATQWVHYSAALQRISMRASRLHIPIIYGIDHLHGASYVSGTAISPHNINLGATSNPELARQTARATVLESADLSDFGAGFEQRGAQYKSSMPTEFGKGLSYTTFAYSGLALSYSVLTGPTARLRATVRVANTGSRAGQEAVLWFLTDEVGRIARPVRQLHHFEKQALAAGQFYLASKPPPDSAGA